MALSPGVAPILALLKGCDNRSTRENEAQSDRDDDADGDDREDGLGRGCSPFPLDLKRLAIDPVAAVGGLLDDAAPGKRLELALVDVIGRLIADRVGRVEALPLLEILLDLAPGTSDCSC